ncbi:capsid protein VP1 [Haloarcula hispanica virus PH1]|uniref:Capsid protein VP1 n=1 Tax=Haloarcula hispanica virus PH1 TaxID=1282967 RepID=M4JFL5_9VIRU|nr:capsid protein VP1 [Haloarcula hispanica virus PH1]AGC65536.1 capsid protein VP1 [Haloarcula hispanica virus PH1]
MRTDQFRRPITGTRRAVRWVALI